MRSSSADAVLARPNGPLGPITTRPENTLPAVGAVQPTPGKPRPLSGGITVVSPPAEGRSPAPDYFLLLPDQFPEHCPPPGCGIFGEALEAAFLGSMQVPWPPSCSCLLQTCILRAPAEAGVMLGWSMRNTRQRDGHERWGFTRCGRVMRCAV